MFQTVSNPKLQNSWDNSEAHKERFANPWASNVDQEMHQRDRHAALPILVYLRSRKLRDTMVKRFERSNQLPGVINPYTKTLITFPHETRTALNPKSPNSLAIFLPEFQPKTPKTPEIQRQTDRGLPSLVVTQKCTKQTDMQLYPFWLSFEEENCKILWSRDSR